MPTGHDDDTKFARMMAHESRRTTIDCLVQAAREALRSAEDENEAAMMVGITLAGTDDDPRTALKLATMVGILAIEIAQLRDASSRAPSR